MATSTKMVKISLLNLNMCLKITNLLKIQYAKMLIKIFKKTSVTKNSATATSNYSMPTLNPCFIHLISH